MPAARSVFPWLCREQRLQPHSPPFILQNRARTTLGSSSGGSVERCWTRGNPMAMGKLIPDLSWARSAALWLEALQGLFVRANLVALFLPAPAGVLLSFCIISSE